MDKLIPISHHQVWNYSICRIIFAIMAMLFYAQYGRAQSLGDPIVHITFGSGSSTFGPALAADSGSTTYLYTGNLSPDDGQYGIYNTTEGLNTGWITTRDHTGNVGGYMMLVNASFDPGIFYTRRVDGLCGGTTYQFGAWIQNLLKANGILPNVSFSIETLDGKVLGGYNTGNIVQGLGWQQYAFVFTTPANLESVVIKMTNNAPGGTGNDIVIDDITFSPYGTPISASFDQATSSGYCVGAPQIITIKTTTPLDQDFLQKLQVYKNHQWVDRSDPTVSSSFSFLGPDTAGQYTYRVVKSDAGSINSPQCVVASNELTVTVQSANASFTAPATTCQSDSVFFFNRSSAAGAETFSLKWDFGDGATSTSISPRHLYQLGGDYSVKLTVTTPYGCVSDTVKSIHVITPVKINFTASAPECPGKAITFADISTSAEGTIQSRNWNFGDGHIETKYDNTPFQHTYDTTGVFLVTLSIATSTGCSTVLTKSVEIHPLPKVNFILPEVCLSDSYAQFTDSSFMADNSSMTYLWDFGDSNASNVNPNTSAAQNPTHQYTEAKQYQVTLTVTSALGCQQTLTKSFTVNGSEPKADFNVLNPSSLCGNRDVYFSNQAAVDFGKITKVTWFYDTGDRSITETDDNPYPGKLYSHKYPASETSKNYQVQMLAYSGQSCVSEKGNTIIVLAMPALTFNAPDSVCLNFGAIQFAAQAGDATTSGSATYTGTGVTSSGLFDPAKAGVGTFNISYIYTASSGCADTLVHIIKVNPVGTVDAGPDVTLLSGGQTTLHATASGDDITYLWSPAAGLSSTTIPDPVASPGKDMTYTLTVTNKYGCSVSDQVNVMILQSPIVPNTFTPNGDGVNDTWIIKYLDTYIGCTVDVFNRNGQKVYTSVNYPVTGWDGRFNGQDLPVGVYYYIIDPRHGRKPFSGYVTIIR